MQKKLCVYRKYFFCTDKVKIWPTLGPRQTFAPFYLIRRLTQDEVEDHIATGPCGGFLFIIHHEVIFLTVCELLAKISDFLVKFDDRVKTKMAADRPF